MAAKLLNGQVRGYGSRPTPSSRPPFPAAATKYPTYANLVNRIASFSTGSGWPANKSQTPKELAEAGLFFAGFSDCTRCFCCGGGLRNWLPGDSAIVEHARFFPDCEYVEYERGEGFAASVEVNYPRSYPDDLPDDIQTDGPEEPAESAVEYDQIVQSVMMKPCGMALDVLGFSPALIKGAVTKVLSENQWDEKRVTSQLLANACFDLKESEKHAAVAENNRSKPNSANRNVRHKENPPPPDSGHVQGIDTIDGPQSQSVSEDSLELERLKISEENRKLKLAMKCKICLDKDVAVVYLPCGHLVTCTECYHTQIRCPVCRSKIVANVRTYI